ncbi:MAG: DNA polymerase IV [Treponema sp.]|jgi:DNA polymerase-4|nr:DNA polymerase IV [Treponema sp.]
MNTFIHADLDAFYASVEQLDHPEYAGKPVIVGGQPGDRRSVVSTASYEARKFGVHSAMPLAQAVKLCPQGIYLRGNMERYQEFSRQIMGILGDFSPEVQQLSVDEAFLNITGTEKLFGPPETLAAKVKAAVRKKTGLTVSVGIASNKYIAKIASGMSKPDGLFRIPPGAEETFMRSLPAGKIWGAGEKTQEIFREHGIRTGEDIYRLSRDSLSAIFGRAFGDFLYRAVRGEGVETFETERGSRSMSTERTFPYDLYDSFTIESVLLDISESLLWRLLGEGRHARTVQVKIRYGDFSTALIQESFSNPVDSLNDLYTRVLALFRKKYQSGRGLRLIGAGLMNLEDGPRQQDLFDAGAEKERKLEKAIMDINRRFPNAVLRRSRSRLSD